MPRDTDFKQTLCADSNGFSLHAAVRCAADDRQALEQLCRCITRPALDDECVQANAAGQVVPKPKTPGRDGTTHCVMSPMEFMHPPIEWLFAAVRSRGCTSATGWQAAAGTQSLSVGYAPFAANRAPRRRTHTRRNRRHALANTCVALSIRKHPDPPRIHLPGGAAVAGRREHQPASRRCARASHRPLQRVAAMVPHSVAKAAQA
jgi:hypothetical protein